MAERTLLLIDRDPEGEAARLFRRHLDGYRVVTASSGEAACRLAEGGGIDAAVLVGLDGPPDWRAVRHVAEALAGVPIAACALARSKRSARELGVRDCLLKPIGRDQVRRALRRLGRQVKSILVVDDDPEMVRLLGRLVTLVSPRYTVWEAQTGSEALSLLETQRPDAVFLDLVMPDPSGDEVLRRIRETAELRDTPVVLVTGHGLEDEEVTAEFLAISRRGGLSVRELMCCLKTDLETVQRQSAAL